jgi:hypothetical protein
MRYRNLRPDELAKRLWSVVRHGIATLHEVNPETRTIVIREVPEGMPVRKGFGIDLERLARLHEQIIDSVGEGTSVLEIMQSVGGNWDVKVLAPEQPPAQQRESLFVIN